MRSRSKSRSRVVSLTSSPFFPEFAARHVEQALAEAHVDPLIGDRRRRRNRLWTLQQQFPRLEWFRQIIVAAGHQSVDAVLYVGESRQHEDRDALVRPAQRLRQRRPGFARHHHVEDKEIESEPAHLVARLGRGRRHGDPEAVLRQIRVQQFADAPIVVDHQDMRFVVTHSRARNLRLLSHSLTLARFSGLIR